MTVLGWIFLPVIILIALSLALVGLLVAVVVVLAFWRGLRFQVTLRCRKVQVPPDGAALTFAETQAWNATLREWKQRASEPVYGEREQW